jgi:hypothetical protein
LIFFYKLYYMNQSVLAGSLEKRKKRGVEKWHAIQYSSCLRTGIPLATSGFHVESQGVPWCHFTPSIVSQASGEITYHC